METETLPIETDQQPIETDQVPAAGQMNSPSPTKRQQNEESEDFEPPFEDFITPRPSKSPVTVQDSERNPTEATTQLQNQGSASPLIPQMGLIQRDSAIEIQVKNPPFTIESKPQQPQQQRSQRKRRSMGGEDNEATDIDQVRLIVNTTRSPRVFPMQSKISTFDQIIDKKLPQLRAQIKAESEPELYYMVTAMQTKRNVFEQAFVEVKQEQEKEVNDQPNPKTVAFSERIDLIYVRGMDKIIEYLTRHLPMDLEAFFEFFQENFSLSKTSYSISLAQFIEIYIVYIEQMHKKSQKDIQKPFHGASDSMTELAFKKYIFGENFLEERHLISEKLIKHKDQVHDIFAQVNPDEPDVLPLDRFREFWLHLTLLTKCIMVKAGTEYRAGQNLREDPDCLNQLHENICLQHYVATRPQKNNDNVNEQGIIRKDDKNWPRQFVQEQMQARSGEDDAVQRPKLIKFADQEVLKESVNDPLSQMQQQPAAKDFVLHQLEEFFSTRRSVVLVDLDSLQAKNIPPREVKQKNEEPDLEKKNNKKGKAKPYVELDPNYVPPPSSVTPEEQKAIDENFFEVFNFYSRKFASVRGDFNQKYQNLAELSLQGYTKFCKDFKVPLSTGEITLVWKKASKNHMPLQFDQFIASIPILGATVNKQIVDKLQSRLKLLNKELLKRKKSHPSGDTNADHVKPSKQVNVEKMSTGAIEGEIEKIRVDAGRTSILTEDQGRVQMYDVMEILYPEKYRLKLPSQGEQELRTNILQAKRLVSNQDQTSNVGSSRISNLGSAAARRLISNPASVTRANRIPPLITKDAQKIKKAEIDLNRDLSKKRPNSLVSHRAQSKSSQDLIRNKPIEIKNQPDPPVKKGGAFIRKQTERVKDIDPLPSASQQQTLPPTPEIISQRPTQETVQTTGILNEIQERKNLAEIHKRIRQEKQQTGNIISVAEAKKLLEAEKNDGKNMTPNTFSPSIPQKKQNKRINKPPVSNKSFAMDHKKIKERLSPAKSSKNLGKQSARDKALLNGKKSSLKAFSPDLSPSPYQNKNKIAPPAQLTFDDIQKMHYSNLNKAGGSMEFRPQDFLDIDSGDSENEILARFKPVGTKPKMISTIKRSSPLKQYQPSQQIKKSTQSIEEQTGYSNSPKFSVYRLNNPSIITKDGSTKVINGFEDQVGSIGSPKNKRNPSNLFELQNEYYQPNIDELAKLQSRQVSSSHQPSHIKLKQKSSSMKQDQLISNTSLGARKHTGISLRTPQINKGKQIGTETKTAQLNSVQIVNSQVRPPLTTKFTERMKLGVQNGDNGLNQNHHSAQTTQIDLMPNQNQLVGSMHDELKVVDDGQSRTSVLQTLGDEKQSITNKFKSQQSAIESISKAPKGAMLGRPPKDSLAYRSNNANRDENLAERKRFGQMKTAKRSNNNAQQQKNDLVNPSNNKQAQTIIPNIEAPQNYQQVNHETPKQHNHTNLKTEQAINRSHLRQSQQRIPTLGQNSQVQLPQNMPGQHLSRADMASADDYTSKKSAGVSNTNSAVSSSNQRALQRAQIAEQRDSQNKKRRMDGLLNLHEQNLQKGLSKAASRR